MYRGAQSSQNSCGAMALPEAQPMSVYQKLTFWHRYLNARSLTCDSICETLLGLTSGISREHQKDCWVHSGERLHEHECHEQANSGGSGGRYSDEDDVADNVDNGEANHCVNRLVPLGDDPPDGQRVSLPVEGCMQLTP
jgi:hypothetical protein